MYELEERFKYYKPRMKTLLEYCKCLYQLEGCSCGGNLHILLDDDNIETDDILFCLNECITHPEDEDSDLGILICKEYLKLSDKERELFQDMWNEIIDSDVMEAMDYARREERSS